MIWHEIVNDVIGGQPVTVTYCPLCNSAVAYHRNVGDVPLDFGTSGYLYQSGMVMYDRQTESLWTHFDGRAVVGTLIGVELERIPAQMLSWASAREAHPGALVLNRDTGAPRSYGTSRYVGHDQRSEPPAGWFTAVVPDELAPMTRVVGVRTPEGQVAIPTVLLAQRRVVETRVGGTPVAVFWQPGTNSPIQRAGVADGDDIGATGAFVAEHDGDRIHFEFRDGEIRDLTTGSVWSIVGRATHGPLAGVQLQRADHLDTFWFAWAAYHTDTRIGP
jgi:hypothetical protein